MSAHRPTALLGAGACAKHRHGSRSLADQVEPAGRLLAPERGVASVRPTCVLVDHASARPEHTVQAQLGAAHERQLRRKELSQSGGRPARRIGIGSMLEAHGARACPGCKPAPAIGLHQARASTMNRDSSVRARRHGSSWRVSMAPTSPPDVVAIDCTVQHWYPARRPRDLFDPAPWCTDARRAASRASRLADRRLGHGRRHSRPMRSADAARRIIRSSTFATMPHRAGHARRKTALEILDREPLRARSTRGQPWPLRTVSARSDPRSTRATWRARAHGAGCRARSRRPICAMGGAFLIGGVEIGVERRRRGPGRCAPRALDSRGWPQAA